MSEQMELGRVRHISFPSVARRTSNPFIETAVSAVDQRSATMARQRENSTQRFSA